MKNKLRINMLDIIAVAFTIIMGAVAVITRKSAADFFIKYGLLVGGILVGFYVGVIYIKDKQEAKEQ